MRRALAFALISGAAFYSYGFFIKGGKDSVVLDSICYYLMADNQTVGRPFDVRFLVPRLVGAISSFFEIPIITIFHLLTPLYLAGSVVIVWRILRAEKAPAIYQACALSAFSIHLGVVYGSVPIVIDPPFLFLVCLAALLLQQQRVFPVLLIATFLPAIKEYGILLTLPCAVMLYRRDKRLLSLAALPVMVLIFSRLYFASNFNAFNYRNGSFLLTSLLFYPGMLPVLGPFRFAQHMLMTMSIVAWPVFAVAILKLFGRVASPGPLLSAARLMLLTLPITFLGNVERTLHPIEPFAIGAASHHEIASDLRFNLLLFGGVFVSAIIRAGWSDIPYPARVFSYFLLAILTLAMLWRLARSNYRGASLASGLNYQVRARLNSHRISLKTDR
jgi:hypothetical protein